MMKRFDDIKQACRDPRKKPGNKLDKFSDYFANKVQACFSNTQKMKAERQLYESK